MSEDLLPAKRQASIPAPVCFCLEGKSDCAFVANPCDGRLIMKTIKGPAIFLASFPATQHP